MKEILVNKSSSKRVIENNCTQNQTLLTRMIGRANESFVFVNGVRCRSLIDSGSMISTISEKFLRCLDPVPEVKCLDEFSLSINVAGGMSLPYLGYVELEIRVDFLNDPLYVPLLVVSATDYNQNVPVVIGTNIIRPCKFDSDIGDGSSKIPNEWKLAFSAISDSQVGTVRSVNKHSIKIKPMSSMTVTGLCRSKGLESLTVITENCENQLSDKVAVCPRVVELKSSVSRIPVRIFNMTAKMVNIKPKSMLCGLSEVKVVRHADFNNDKKSDISTTERELDMEDLKKLGIEIRDDLSSEVKQKLIHVLSKWQSIFSKGPTDLGYTDLIEHEIKLTDDKPFKEPYRRIPPSMFNEVKEHLKEMLEAGCIRESSSPYSSNVVLVRKKDNSLRLCLDFRRLNKLTVRDCFALPRISDTIDCLVDSKFYTKLDLRSAYWQCALKESDRHKTAFNLGPLGFYECNRLAFGLTNAGASFQRLMEKCMGEAHLRDCLIYLDDIIIFSKKY